MNLGTRVDPKEIESAPSNIGRWSGRVDYPSLNLNGKACERFCDRHDFDLGGEFTATVKFRVTAMSDTQYGKSISFDVMSINGVKSTKNLGDDLKAVMDGDEPS